MNEMVSILVLVGGGLGTFLLGMKHLSEGLQAVSGSGLRKFMSLATTHRLAGVGTGIVSTVIVQSSSIITVMAVGFVSSGLMNLTQAINVIIGSNIGTTATAWLIAFAPDVKMLGLFVVLVGGVFYFFQSREKLHDLGLALMGLGFIFMGLYWMKEGTEPIRGMPAVVEMFKALDATSAWGLAKCVLVSLIFTAVVQSSAATTAIAMTLAQQGLLSFEAAAATVFGMNIGTTVTAWLAAFNGSAEARQTALAHTLFNVAGTVLIVPFFVPVILPIATSFFPHYADAVMVGGVTMFPHVAAPMAAIHTLFNLITTALFLPLVKQFAAFIARLIRSDESVKPHLSALTQPSRLSPVIACDQALLEVAFMRDSDLELLSGLREVLNGTANDKQEEHIIHREVHPRTAHQSRVIHAFNLVRIILPVVKERLRPLLAERPRPPLRIRLSPSRSRPRRRTPRNREPPRCRAGCGPAGGTSPAASSARPASRASDRRRACRSPSAPSARRRTGRR